MLPDGTLDLALPLSPKTKLIAVTHASNVTGTIVPIRSIVNLAKQVGAAVLVDGAQAAPHLPIDVEQLGIDFYAFSGHKCYGPTGIGILYGKQERLASLSCWQGGGDMVDRVEFETSSYQEAPLRFEAGTPLIGSAIGLGAALEFLEELDRSQVERWETHLQEMTREKLLKIEGLTLLGSAPRTTPLLSFSIDGIHPLDLAGYLDCKNIAIRTGHLCAQPLLSLFGLTSVARVSLGLYNTEEDIQRFSVALQEAVRVLRPRAISSVVE
jgi:cysteine desulfurase/selenocysteine lyase